MYCSEAVRGFFPPFEIFFPFMYLYFCLFLLIIFLYFYYILLIIFFWKNVFEHVFGTCFYVIFTRINLESDLHVTRLVCHAFCQEKRNFMFYVCSRSTTLLFYFLGVFRHGVNLTSYLVLLVQFSIKIIYWVTDTHSLPFACF